MLPDRVSNPGPLTYESGALPIALRGPANNLVWSNQGNIPVKFESHWPGVNEELALKANNSRFSIFSSGGHFVHRS